MRPTRPLLVLGLILLIYLALEVPTVSRYGIAWDEQVDLDIARSYLAGAGGWLRGSSFDATQARLPMYSVALVFSLLGRSSLVAARLVSCLLGGLTLVAVYLFCRAELDRKRGLFACLLLATSPYFLSFARIAFTESDIFVTCALAWFLVCLSTLLRMRTVGWSALTGTVLGLAISSKVSSVVLLPLALLAPLFLSQAGARPPTAQLRGKRRVLAGILPAVLVAGILQTWWTGWLEGGVAGRVATACYVALVLLWLSILLWLLRIRRLGLDAATTGILVAALACATFFLVPPVHTTNPEILLGILKRFLGTLDVRPASILEFGAFHAGCVVFKSSPLVGAGLWAGLLASAARWRSRPPLRLPILVFAVYFVFLLRMDIAQTFYMMPLLPVLAILASDAFFGIQPRGGARRRVLVTAGAVLAFALLTRDLTVCYPDYNLNGLQWLGARYLAGRSTLGYRGIAQVTTDGVEQSLEWVRRRAGEEETVVTYVVAPHIIRAVWPQPRSRIVDGLRQPEALARGADYVVIGINAEIADDWGPPRGEGDVYRRPFALKTLEERFRKVFSVRRAFGLEVASVWRGRDRARGPGGPRGTGGAGPTSPDRRAASRQ